MLFFNNASNNTFLVMITHKSSLSSGAWVLTSLEIHLHIHVKETWPFPKGLAFTEGLNISGLTGDLIAMFTPLLDQLLQTEGLNSLSPKPDRIACHSFFYCIIYFFNWFVRVFCIQNHSLLQVFQISSSSLTFIFELYSVV